MVQRVTFGSLAIIAVLTVVMMDVAVAQWCHDLDGPLGALLRRGSVIPAVWLALVLAGAVELNHILRLKALRPHTLFAYVMIVVLVLTPWASAAGWMGYGAAQVEGFYWLVTWLLVAGVGTGICGVVRGDPQGILRDVGATWLMIIYLGFFGAFAVQLRCGCDTPAWEGAWLLLIVVLVTKSSDIGAYLVGSKLGRHRLCPSLSPGKSVEGAIAGLVTAALVSVLLVEAHSLAVRFLGGSSGPQLDRVPEALSSLIADATRAFGAEYNPNGLSPTVRAFFFGLALSAAGQIGDIVESCFKRDAGIKDSGRVLPRFGGILDIMDSPLFAVPVGWFLLTAVWTAV